MTSPTTLIVLAVILASCVILSVYNAAVALVWACQNKSWLVASRAAYPLMVVASCGFMLDHIQFKITGTDGFTDVMVIVIGVFMFIATLLRTLAIVIHKDGKQD